MTLSFGRHSLAAVLAVGLVSGSVAAGDNPILLSVNQSGGAAGDWVYYVNVSANGRYVLFDSEGLGLVPAATTPMRRIYLRDALLGQTELCSVNSAGQAISASSDHPTMSADARFVYFGATASPELSPGGQYLRDRALLTTTPAPSVGFKVQLSDDGQWLAGASGQALLKHVSNGAVEMLSVSDEGEPANAQVFIETYQCLSADMRFAVFETQASNLDLPTGGNRQVFVRDRLLGTTRLVSTTPAGVVADGSCTGASLSADGRFVAFQSYAKNLAGLDPDAQPQVYVKDLLTGGVELVSVTNAGEPSTSESEFFTPLFTTSLSGDGRFVAFAIETSNLAPGIAGTAILAVVRDRLAGLTYAVSVDQQGHYTHGLEPMLSRTGRAIAFVSAGPCVPQDTNGNATDAYLFDRMPWPEIEPGLAGSTGVPRLVMQGAPAAQAPILLAITHTQPFALSQLVVGFGQANLPFKGGTLVPVPAVLLPLPTNAQGMIVLKAHWPAGVPAGTPLALQAWIPDLAGPFGFAATNGVANTAQ